jgi:hypothetical protein
VSAPPPPRRIIVTLDLEDDPLTDTLAVQALLHLLEWFHHEGVAPTRTALEITGPTTT